ARARRRPRRPARRGQRTRPGHARQGRGASDGDRGLVMTQRQLIGAALLVVGLMAMFGGRLIGPAVLWAVALLFYAAYRRARRTWPLVAFGVLASVAATATVEELFRGWDGGVVFLL